MALGMILVLFIAISVVSGLGILFLLLTKNEKVKKGMYYFLAVWGLVIASDRLRDGDRLCCGGSYEIVWFDLGRKQPWESGCLYFWEVPPTGGMKVSR